jgi:hypothetical protein
MGANVGKAASLAGLPTNSIPQFVKDIITQNTTGVANIPGVSSSIISAGVDAVLDTYAIGFRDVWITAIPFIVLAAMGTFNSSYSPQFLTNLSNSLHLFD